MIVAILLLTLVHEGKPHFGKPEVEHRGLCSNVLLRNTTAEKCSSSQLRAMSRIARDLVLPAPNTPAIHKSERPVRMTSSSATVTARAGVRSRRSVLTSASVTFVFLSAAMRRTGMPG